jgi:hypothetical protein
MKTFLHPALFLPLLLLASTAEARVNLDTIPDRDSVQLTIYNSVDLTMVRETRHLTLRKGLNHLEFSWANTLIDPTSLEFKALSRPDEIELLDASYPPRAPNTLEWRIKSEFSGEAVVEIRYFTSGISWSADYVAESNREETKANLAGFVRVNNRSGEDYENAQIRLVVGVIKMVEDVAALARAAGSEKETRLLRENAPHAVAPRSAAISLSLAAALRDEGKAKEVIKEGLSEYFLYTVEGRDTVPNGWSKRLPSFSAADVPWTSFYKFEQGEWGGAVERFYRFKNDKKSKLGVEPLPNGGVIAFRRASEDRLYSVAGQTAVKYIPIGEEVEMDLGPDREVLVKPSLMDWRKEDLRFDKHGNVAGWTVTEEWRVETQNSKDITVTVDVRRDFAGDWSLKTESAFEKMDANRVKFLLTLKPREKQVIQYEIVTRQGVNASK